MQTPSNIRKGRFVVKDGGRLVQFSQSAWLGWKKAIGFTQDPDLS